MSKIKDFFRKAWEYIVYTKIGKLIVSLALAFGSFALANVWDFMFYVGLAFMIYPIGLFCVMMAYAWVINPIRDWKESKKTKEEAKINSELKPIVEEPVVAPAPVVKIMAPTVIIKEVDNTVVPEPKKVAKKAAPKKRAVIKNKKKK